VAIQTCRGLISPQHRSAHEHTHTHTHTHKQAEEIVYHWPTSHATGQDQSESRIASYTGVSLDLYSQNELDAEASNTTRETGQEKCKREQSPLLRTQQQRRRGKENTEEEHEEGHQTTDDEEEEEEEEEEEQKHTLAPRHTCVGIVVEGTAPPAWEVAIEAELCGCICCAG
jgi:hypothetical protein